MHRRAAWNDQRAWRHDRRLVRPRRPAASPPSAPDLVIRRGHGFLRYFTASSGSAPPQAAGLGEVFAEATTPLWSQVAR